MITLQSGWCCRGSSGLVAICERWGSSKHAVLVAISEIGWNWIQELLLWMEHSNGNSPSVKDWLSGLILVHPSPSSSQSQSRLRNVPPSPIGLESLIPSTIPTFVILSSCDGESFNDNSLWSSLFLNRPKTLVLIINDDDGIDNQSLNTSEENADEPDNHSEQAATTTLSANAMKKYIEQYHWLVWLSRTIARYTEALAALAALSYTFPPDGQKPKLLAKL